MLEEVKKLGGSLFFCWVQRGFVGDERLAGATGRRGRGQCRQQNPSSFYFWDSYLRITIQKSIHESHNFLNDPIIKS